MEKKVVNFITYNLLVVHLIKEVTPLIATADRRHLIEYKLSIQGVKLLNL